jgi:hypothetical protein
VRNRLPARVSRIRAVQRISRDTQGGGAKDDDLCGQIHLLCDLIADLPEKRGFEKLRRPRFELADNPTLQALRDNFRIAC